MNALLESFPPNVDKLLLNVISHFIDACEKIKKSIRIFIHSVLQQGICYTNIHISEHIENTET